MHTNTDNIYRILHRFMREQRRSGGFMTRRNPATGSCGTPTQAHPKACDGAQACRPEPLLSCETRQLQDASNRTAYYTPSVAGLAAGATTPAAAFATVPAIGALDFLNLSGRARTVYLTDFVSSIASLDGMLVIVAVAGVVRFSLNGGRFARGNANTSTQACGLYVCAGALETVSVTVFNQSGAAFGVVDTARIETRTVFDGEDGYMCQPCAPQQADCQKCAGEESGASASFEEVL